VLLFGTLTIIHAARHFSQRFTVVDNGIAVRTLRRETLIEWDSIVELRYSSTLVTSQKRGLLCFDWGILYSQGNPAITFNAYYHGYMILGAVIERMLLAKHYAECRRQYDQGEWVRFGGIEISRQGLMKNGVVSPWNLVKAVGIRNGWFEAEISNEQYRKWLVVSTRKIGNLCILRDLLRGLGIETKGGPFLFLDVDRP
jgi:hypothetical protein